MFIMVNKSNALIRLKGNRKRAQMKIQQMAFVLIALTLFFSLAGIFALRIYLSQTSRSVVSLEENKALQLVSKLSSTAEFSCGNSFSLAGAGSTNCVDYDKVMVLKSSNYGDFWGVKEIEIRRIYPERQTQADVVCETNNYPNCNLITVYSGAGSDGTPASNFVILCRKDSLGGESYDKCEMAILTVTPKNKVN